MTISTLTYQLQAELARSTGTTVPTQDANTPSQQLVDKFQALMAQPDQSNHSTQPAQSTQSTQSTQSADSNYQVPPVHSTGHADLVTKAVSEQADYYRQVPNDVLYMSQHMSAMSMERLAAADMTIQLEIASLNADLQVKMATVQSSKDAVQTLMKNQ